VSFSGLSTDLLPNIELPYVVVITAYPGASPEKVEQSVTRPLESVLGTTGGLKNMNSISNENTSIIILEFVQTVNMDSVVIEISNSLDTVSAQLESAVNKPMLLRISPDMMPVMAATVSMKNGSIAEVSDYVTDTLLPAVERIEGVGSVTASGLLEKKLQVTLDASKIEALNERVTADLERSLGEARSKLKEARAELAAARRKLEDESAKQQAKLSEAGVQLDSAIANLQSLLAEETLLEAQKNAFEQEKNALAELEKLNQIFSQFPGGIASLPPAMYQAIMEQLAHQLPAELAGLTQEEMAELEEKAAGAPTRIVAIETELHNINVRLQVLKAMKPQLEAGLVEAQAGYQELEAGKITLSIELAAARAQLDSGLAELEEGLSELNAAQEEAREQADLNRIITVETVDAILKAQNFTMPAGYIREGEQDYLVKVVGSYESEDALKDAVIFSLESTGDIRLSDVAEVAVVDNAGQNYAKVNGEDCAILMIQKQSIASTTEVTEKIHNLFNTLSGQEKGLHVLVLMDQGEYINMSIRSVLENLTWGGILALLVLIFFLMDYRPTLVIAVSIPISLLFALTLMYFNNVSLNIISLSGLALGVGMLVDNSIVVIDNIYRLREEGLAVHKAAVFGARQVAGAISASTLTTVCVFLPIVFTQGLSRQLFTDMGLTIAYSLLASLAVALTLVPTLAATVLKSSQVKRLKWFDAFVKAYETVLCFSLKKKIPVLAAVALLLGLSIYGVTIMGTSFLPEADYPQMSATMTLPEEREGEDIYALNDEIAKRILEIDDVQSVGAMSGTTGGGMGMGPMQGDTTFFILLNEENRTLSNRDVEKIILQRTEDLGVDISFSTSNMDMSVLGGSGIQVVVKGNDLDTLALTAEEIASLLRETEGIDEVVTGEEDAKAETRVILDREATIRAGLTTAQVYQKIVEALST
ncbi:MAG TPA: MMPL family transporter, partial [Firmicutes bacterium]|nr:MMPL family transporter [Bacillota bacterium]